HQNQIRTRPQLILCKTRKKLLRTLAIDECRVDRIRLSFGAPNEAVGHISERVRQCLMELGRKDILVGSKRDIGKWDGAEKSPIPIGSHCDRRALIRRCSLTEKVFVQPCKRKVADL